MNDVCAARPGCDLITLQQLCNAYQLTTVKFPVVLVAGTNGKGSTVALLTAIYQAAGYHVASFTSPHLLQFNERLQINNENVSDQTWLIAFNTVYPLSEHWQLNYFQTVFIAALFIVTQLITDLTLGIFEIGLGGRLDPVNLLTPILSVITNVALDHWTVLGATRELIAAEKAGVMRAQTPVIYGESSVPSAIIQAAAKQSARLYCVDRDYQLSINAENCVEFVWPAQAIKYLAPAGHWQIAELGTALMTIALLQTHLPVTDLMIQRGIAQAKLLGRLSYYAGDIAYLYDVSHNAHAFARLAKYLIKWHQQHPAARMHAVLGLYHDKIRDDLLSELWPLLTSWQVLVYARGSQLRVVEHDVLTTLKPVLFPLLQTSGPVTYHLELEQALRAAQQEARHGDLIVIFGSFQTVSVLFLCNSALVRL